MPKVFEALSRAQSELGERQAAPERQDAASPGRGDQVFPTERISGTGVTGVSASDETVAEFAPVGTAREPRVEQSHVSGTDVATMVSRIHTAGTGLCPHCDAYADSQLPPAFLRWSYRVTRRPMHLCRTCGNRYHTPKSSRSKQGAHMPAFLVPAGGRSFQDLVRDMARDERDWHHSEDLKRSR